ncbi:chemotaxis protein CheW [Microcoleus sp. Pol12B5]|uniref:chemotaxis protein CheW n=1 Tax=unclassified Microcoleus TaxID=2642155 RepID=UPI002FCFB7D0
MDCSPVVEIVPTFTLKKLHSAPEYIPGLLNYRGHLVRVIELCSLIQGTLNPRLMGVALDIRCQSNS